MRLIVYRLLNIGQKVVFYTPHQEDCDVSHSIYKEMTLLAAIQPGEDTGSLFSTQTGEDFSNADVLGN